MKMWGGLSVVRDTRTVMQVVVVLQHRGHGVSVYMFRSVAEGRSEEVEEVEGERMRWKVKDM
ncbi:hypothetical protein E2C01_087269 [Portunus trituberculatus]|uniref:Uncharacterized protein n=1 Tax=Portunus trituberculatus TaxID=210409 RepID=A0A5B7JC09_PORTR|nr:hypothetical protein [Portunus trituberculatus]